MFGSVSFEGFHISLQEKKLKSKKKKTNMPGGGGFKVSLKNDFDSYGVVDDSYREYDDFM